MKNHSELEKIHKSALRIVRDQIKKHSLGKLGFLSFIGTRPWGIAQSNVDYDYRGIYINKEDNTYHAFIAGLYINNYAKDITMISFERFIEEILQLNIHSLVLINSPIIYADKNFLELRKWINSNFSKQIYWSCQTKTHHANRKDYIYDFFFLGNGISVLEQRKIIANLPKLSEKCLKIPAINKIIKEERAGLPFEAKSKKICKKILQKLKTRLEKANKKSRLPEKMNMKKFSKLKIMRQVNYDFWNEKGIILRHQKERKKDGLT